MKLPLSWLKRWVDSGLAPRELGDRMTLAGFELESIAPAAPAFSGVVVAEILSAERHPQADKLQVCRVSIGGTELQIVCGAANARAGLRTALAQVGAVLPGDLKIKAAKLRGVESAGMLCSAKELGLAEVSDGILELPADTALGADLRVVLDLDDPLLEFAITPNRGDAMSVQGLAREVSALTGAALGGPDCEPIPAAVEVPSAGFFAQKSPAVSLSAGSACPRFHHRVLVDIDNSRPSPLWLRERLRRAGQRSISPIVDITNYIVLELGQPMHVYDLDKIEGGALDVRFARGGESCDLLDGLTVELAPDVLVIADAAGPVAMAGVMGGVRTSVTPQTTRVMLEVAWFAPSAIAGRGRRYGLTTDASQRFERGVDPELGRRAIERATRLMLEVAGGIVGAVEVTEVAAEDGTAAVRRAPRVTLRPAQVGRVLGLEMPPDRVIDLLSRIGIRLVDGAAAHPAAAVGETLTFQSPSHRFDIAIERDLIEEVARLVGFEAIPVVDARAAQPIRALPTAQLEEQRLLDLFASRGWQEGVHFSFVDPVLQEQLFPGVPSHRLSNPIASDLAVMRLSLWPGLLRAAQENLRRQQGRIRLFEHGVVFPVGAPEIDRFGGVAVGGRRPEQWGEDEAPGDFYDVRADLEALGALVGQTGCLEFERASLGCLHPGRSARILRGGRPVGWVGELHPRWVRELGFPSAPVLFELDVAALVVEYPVFTEVSRFPQLRRDLAVVLAEDATSSSVLESVTLASSGLLRQVFVFDVYRGMGIETARKSIALGLIFQDKNSTLTEEVIEGEMAAIRAALTLRLGASFRE